MFGKLSARLIMMFLVSMLLVMGIAVPGTLARDGFPYYDQTQLNATIAALVHSNGPVTQVSETLDHSSFSIRFANDLHIQLPCDFGRHYYKNVNTCVSTSKMVIIYDHCQFSMRPDCWNEMPFCFLDSTKNDVYGEDNCLPYFKLNKDLCRCELKK
ncbi:uncharacterized protein LOC117242686 [Bombus vosnesenskii]|uniref:Uncharacterized protein LOC117242686 n=1 Tax=Bombus vosnesenskii TaxID=207650 RepID=A0A6J3LL88_9HYME|nr:uncharacterized protein LOC117242686 [Bombus vosnesenskii]